MNRLSSFGVAITFFYLLFLIILALANWIDFRGLKPNEWGDFLAGSLGPLAIFWLVLGFFQQGRELRHSVEALKLQAEELKNSVEQQRAMVDITNRQLELDVEVREEQTRVAVSQELPYLQLLAAGSTGGGPGRRNYRFKVRNVGAPAVSGTYVVKSPGIPPNTQEFPYLDKSRDFDVGFEALIEKLNSNAQPDMKFTFEIQNIRGQTRKQVFQLKEGKPLMVECDPKQA